MTKFSGARTWVGDDPPGAVDLVDAGAYACACLTGWSIRTTDGGPVIIDFRDGTADGKVMATVIVPVSSSSNVRLPAPIQAASGAVYAKTYPAGRIARGVIYSA